MTRTGLRSRVHRFESCWGRIEITSEYFLWSASIIVLALMSLSCGVSLADLIRSKEAAGRPKDVQVLPLLYDHQAMRSSSGSSK